MLARFRKDPLIGNVLGAVALFIALGAGAYAAGLAPNSVKSKHIKDGQVKEQDLGPGSVTNTALGPDTVTAENVLDDDLSGADIDEDGLASVPNADSAADASLLDGNDSTAFQQQGSEGWTNMTLQNASSGASCNWITFPGGFATPGYFRDGDGIVHLRGVVRAVDGAPNTCGDVPALVNLDRVITTLPAGYRPQTRTLFTVSSNNAPGRVDVASNTGNVEMEPGYPSFANAEVWVSLDGITFRCAPAGASGCP